MLRSLISIFFLNIFILISASAQSIQKLPDGEISQKNGLISYLIDPTTRYNHAVLGDAIEAGGFAVEERSKVLTYFLPQTAVFEDLRVRLEDLNGDGRPEAIIIKSYIDKGAAIAIYRIGPERIEHIAESSAIGIRNRWLNIVGFADFLGNGEKLIAAVITPHIVGSLRLYRLERNELKEVVRIDGFTNHDLGSRDLDSASIINQKDHPPLIRIKNIVTKQYMLISFKNARPEIIKTE